MKKEKWNPSDYQGKRRYQVESSYYGFFVAGLLLLFIIGIALIKYL